MLRRHLGSSCQRVLSQPRAYWASCLAKGVSHTDNAYPCKLCNTQFENCLCAGLPACRLQHTDAASKLKPEHSSTQASSTSWPLYGFLGESSDLLVTGLVHVINLSFAISLLCILPKSKSKGRGSFVLSKFVLSAPFPCQRSKLLLVWGPPQVVQFYIAILHAFFPAADPLAAGHANLLHFPLMQGSCPSPASSATASPAKCMS